ncbi:MAG: PAS domain S-box protein, partial [Thermodesulfovibrio sp.]|nr:PAS domain S-box protein [Thermodesulfovibrio sp.]
MLDILNKSIEIYRIIVENAGEGIVIAQDDKILFVNPKMLEISGYTLEEALSKPFLEFLYPDDIPETMDLYTRMIKGEKDLPEKHQLRIIHKEGYPVWIETTTVPINWHGRTATLNFIRDITEIKKAEEENQKLQEQLIQSHKMESIGRFIAGIIHDLNNILTPIKGFTQLSIAKTGEHDPVNEYLKIIFSSVEKAEEFVKQLLTFCKKQPSRLEVLNVNELIEHIEDILKR